MPSLRAGTGRAVVDTPEPLIVQRVTVTWPWVSLSWGPSMHPEASDTGVEPVHHRWRGRARLRDVRTLNWAQQTALHVAGGALFVGVILVTALLYIQQPVGVIVDPVAMCPYDCRRMDGCVLGSSVGLFAGGG